MTHYTDIEAISAHIERHIGRIGMVFHEIVSDDLHIDIHHVKSSWRRPYEVLITSGMSALPMNVPPDSDAPRFAEIVTILPRGWPLTQDAFADERNYWPLRLMKMLARWPHHANTWLGFGHTVAGEEPEPFAASTKLCAAVLLPPVTLDEAAWCLEKPDGERICFWAAVPLHLSELKFKLEHGTDALLELFDDHGVTDRIDPERPSVV